MAGNLVPKIFTLCAVGMEDKISEFCVWLGNKSVVRWAFPGTRILIPRNMSILVGQWFGWHLTTLDWISAMKLNVLKQMKMNQRGLGEIGGQKFKADSAKKERPLTSSHSLEASRQYVGDFLKCWQERGSLSGQCLWGTSWERGPMSFAYGVMEQTLAL